MTNDTKQSLQLASLRIYESPIDIPSIEKALSGEDQPWLSDGYFWKDKPHRVMNHAIEEIRALRTYIINNLTPPNK